MCWESISCSEAGFKRHPNQVQRCTSECMRAEPQVLALQVCVPEAYLAQGFFDSHAPFGPLRARQGNNFEKKTYGAELHVSELAACARLHSSNPSHSAMMDGCVLCIQSKCFFCQVQN